MKEQSTTATPASASLDATPPKVLYCAFELSNSTWKMSFSPGTIQKRNVTITAWNLDKLHSEINEAIKHFGLPPDVITKSCYEAGRDAHALHRHLEKSGIQNVEVDSSSIQVDRRAKHAKTDRLDVEKLRILLIRYHTSEPKTWSVVRVPSEEQEDERMPNRELEELKRERTRLSNRIGSLLKTQGTELEVNRNFGENIESLKKWDNALLPKHLLERLKRAFLRWDLVQDQISELEKEIATRHKEQKETASRIAAKLQQLKGIGPVTAEVLATELFWRDFRNRKEIAAFVGLVPMPYCSGDLERCQGISKAGRSSIRKLMIELSWIWERYQGESEITRWFYKKIGSGSKRFRKVAIVGVARKLLIALWRYAMDGTIPEGAIMKKELCKA